MMNLLYASALIWGIKCLFSDGFIFYFNRASWPDWVKKPLLTCPPCMSSVWGTVWFLYITWQYPFHAGEWIVFCVQLCGLNFFMTKLIDKERIIIEDDNN